MPGTAATVTNSQSIKYNVLHYVFSHFLWR